MPVFPAPTVKTAAPQAVAATPANKAPLPTVPFTRAARAKNLVVGTYGPFTLGTSQVPLPGIQIRPAGFLRRLVVKVIGTTTGNAAAVAFNNDGPFNVLQQIAFLSPANNALMSSIDGFTLFAVNKYFALGSGRYDPLNDPFYKKVVGAGANGGSFAYKAVIPVEVDSRDAFGAIENMAANTQFVLNAQLNTLANLYTVAPTTPPQVTVTVSMEYYSAPAPTNGQGYPQATQPYGAGSLSLLQTQTVTPNPSSNQNFQIIGVGNTIRAIMYILRDSSGVRSEAGFSQETKVTVNNDLYFDKDLDLWRAQLAQEYNLSGGITAVPTSGAQDAGVLILTEFMNTGSMGNADVNGASNRDLYLVTGTGTSLYTEAVQWGAAASKLLVVENVLKPSSAEAMYAPEMN